MPAQAPRVQAQFVTDLAPPLVRSASRRADTWSR
jgi:hypothetical protein